MWKLMLCSVTLLRMEEMDIAYRDTVNGLPSRRPIIEMTIPSVLDKTISPTGACSWFIFCICDISLYLCIFLHAGAMHVSTTVLAFQNFQTHLLQHSKRISRYMLDPEDIKSLVELSIYVVFYKPDYQDSEHLGKHCAHRHNYEFAECGDTQPLQSFAYLIFYSLDFKSSRTNIFSFDKILDSSHSWFFCSWINPRFLQPVLNMYLLFEKKKKKVQGFFPILLYLPASIIISRCTH